MARPPRIQYENATYHLYSRGNRRERLFLKESDYAVFEDMSLQAMRRTGITLFNWSLMPNHVHFHLETPHGNIAEFAHRLFTRYAQYFNRAYQYVGHVFQGRYGSRLVNHETHFQEIVRYVELNPYRLKKGKLADLGQWKWSSWRYYQLPENQWPVGCHEAFTRVLERFGSSPVASRQGMAQFLTDGLSSGTWEDFYKVDNKRFLGDEAFVEKAKQKNGEPVRQFQRKFMADIDAEQLLRHVEKLSRLSTGALIAPDKRRSASRWRQALCWVARRVYRLPLVRLAKMLNRSDSAIGMMVARHEAYANQSEETQALIRVLRVRGE